MASSISFRNTDEINLWNQWASNFAMRFSAEEAAIEADRMLANFRDRMSGIVLQTKPGRA